MVSYKWLKYQFLHKVQLKYFEIVTGYNFNISHEFGMNMIATKLEDSGCVVFLILYIKYYIFMVTVIHSWKILSEGFKIPKDNDISMKQISLYFKHRNNFHDLF